jgi:hypothetical protein
MTFKKWCIATRTDFGIVARVPFRVEGRAVWFQRNRRSNRGAGSNAGEDEMSELAAWDLGDERHFQDRAGVLCNELMHSGCQDVGELQ